MSDEHARYEAVRENYRAMIEKFGFAKVGVFDPAGQTDSFIYTVGFEHKDMPELVIGAAFDVSDLSMFVDHFAHDALHEGHALRTKVDAFTLGDDSSYDLRLVEVDPVFATDRVLVQAESILKRPVTRVCQIQISDAQKRWPGEEGFDDKFRQMYVGSIIAK